MLDRKFEVLNNEIDLIQRINELKDMGYEEKDMYVVTLEEDNVSVLKGHTDVMIKEEDHSIFDRFISFLQGEDSVIDTFRRMGLKKEDKEYYYNEVKNGRILLLVDKEHESKYILGEDGIFRPIEEVEEFFDENKEEIEEIKEIENQDLDSTEDIPSSIKKDIGLENEDIEKDKSAFGNKDFTGDSYRR